MNAFTARQVVVSRPVSRLGTTLLVLPCVKARLGVRLQASSKPDGTDRTAPNEAPDVGELAKAALVDTMKGEKMTAKDVLGEGTLNQLRRALGEERAGSFEGALDALLANRRLATLLFAVLDVALIVVAVKLFRSAVSQD
uniref:182392m n=2 Tax=Chlamydomonas reinhardtii TaxID=3055 RepID=D5LAY7_CHLRE|nr:182392m [Chlamydomonas reinhardtii]